MTIAVSSSTEAGFTEFIRYRIESGRVCEEERIACASGGPGSVAGQMAALEIDLLIAGEIDAGLRQALYDAGVHLLAGQRGRPESLVAGYLNGTLNY